MNEGNYGSQEAAFDEDVTTTLKRQAKSIALKVKYSLLMLPSDRQEAVSCLKDWDLWGPLLICLIFSLTIGLCANEKYTYDDFVNVFLIFWVGSLLASVNCRLLGNKGSVFQQTSVIGYSMLPLAIIGLIVSLVRVIPIWIKLPLIIIALIWSTVSCMIVMRDLISDDKKYLAAFPIFLVYIFLAWYSIIA